MTTSNRLIRILVLLAVLGMGVSLVNRNSSGSRGGSRDMPYSQFVDAVQRGQVVSGSFERDRFYGTLTPGGAVFVVNLPSEESPERARLYQQMQAAHVRYDFRRPALSDSVVGTLVSFLLPLAVIFFFWMYFLRRAQAGPSRKNWQRNRGD